MKQTHIHTVTAHISLNNYTYEIRRLHNSARLHYDIENKYKGNVVLRNDRTSVYNWHQLLKQSQDNSLTNYLDHTKQ